MIGHAGLRRGLTLLLGAAALAGLAACGNKGPLLRAPAKAVPAAAASTPPTAAADLDADLDPAGQP